MSKRLSLVNDGTRWGTKLLTASGLDLAEELDIRAIHWSVGKSAEPRLVLEVASVCLAGRGCVGQRSSAAEMPDAESLSDPTGQSQVR